MRKIDLTSFNIATSDTARNINRRIILDLIRTRQPVSRADLARISGLQRSTISLITEQLLIEQWITQGALGHLPRGRKPRFLHLNVERAGIIGVNVRPTATTIALADLNARFIAHESFPTDPDADVFIEDLTGRLRAFIKLHPQIYIEGVGVSIPGRVDSISKRIVFAPNLGWRDVDLLAPLERATELPVEIENAANACALAEIWFDKRSDGIQDLIAVTVSEGVGTGIISNGQLVRGANGVAGEFGHVSIDQSGPLCKCGNRGCWEVFASNTAAINEYVQNATGNGSKKQNNQFESDKPSFDDILHLSEQGDARAIKAIERMGHYLGIGLSMLISGMAPSMIVVIGEITRSWKRIEPIIKNILTERLLGSPMVTRIVPAEDNLQPRLRGSMALILQKHFGAPLTA
ncbi:MAG TPA: ROK family protein [Pyrinomonadaceae bacterium]|nr:ROK family protein [Pyrinomonadaceae bacterium]